LFQIVTHLQEIPIRTLFFVSVTGGFAARNRHKK
jgi:hypothetical protein